MARIPIDTGVASTTTVKAAFDGINTMTSELYAMLGDPANMVTLGGQGLRRTAAYTSAPSAATYVTVAARFKCPTNIGVSDYPTLLCGNGGLSGLYIWLERLDATTARMGLMLRNAAGGSAVGPGQYLKVPGGASDYVFTGGQTYTFHWASSSGANTNQFWVNGVIQHPKTWPTATSLDFTSYALSSVCCVNGASDPTQTFTDLIGFVWMGAGTDSAWYITDTSKFYNSTTPTQPPYLGPSGQTPNGLQPLLFLGGTHLVNEWLAGTNFGFGGDFSVATG
jgi:hypothetical protein